MTQCLLCHKNVNSLVKCHIIPRSFYKALKDEKPYAVLMNVGKKLSASFHQSGLYDPNIVCKDCERRFTACDTHGYHVLTDALINPQLYKDSKGYPVAFLIKNVDYYLLKRFILAVLWRAHHAENVFWSNVDLGPHEERIRQIILNDSKLESEKYSVAFYHLIDHEFPHMMFPPKRSKIGGVNIYQIYLPDIVSLIKVDKRPFPHPFDIMMLKEKPPHYLCIWPYQESLEQRYLSNVKRQIREVKSI